MARLVFKPYRISGLTDTVKIAGAENGELFVDDSNGKTVYKNTAGTLMSNFYHGSGDNNKFIRYGSGVNDIYGDSIRATDIVDDIYTKEVNRVVHTSLSGKLVRQFIYDTKKDHKRGIWIEQCDSKSWFTEVTTATGNYLGEVANETAARAVPYATTGDYYHNLTDGLFYSLNASTGQSVVTRGSRKDFPEVVLIVIEQKRVIYYDVTQNSCPMWMTISPVNVGAFAATSGLIPLTDGLITNGTMLNGILYLTTGTDLFQVTGTVAIDFIADNSHKWYTSYSGVGTGLCRINNSIARRHIQVPTTPVPGYTYSGLSNSPTTCIAATVLDSAPINPTTGMPAATVVVGTDNGLVFIKDNNTVSNMTGIGQINSVNFDSNGGLFVTYGTGAGYKQGYQATLGTWAYTFDGYSIPKRPGSNLNSGLASVSCSGFRDTKIAQSNAYYDSAFLGLTILRDNPMYPTNAMYTAIGKTFNTGWQVGDTVRSFLNDTAVETLVGEEYPTPIELFNGASSTFTSLTTGSWLTWGGATISGASGSLVVTNGATDGGAYYQFITVPGRAYDLVFTNVAGLCYASVGTSAGLADIVAPMSEYTTYSVQFVATGVVTYVSLGFNTGAVQGSTATHDNFSCKLAPKSLIAGDSSTFGMSVGGWAYNNIYWNASQGATMVASGNRLVTTAPAAKPITGATWSNKVATITCAGHGLTIGKHVVLSGFTPTTWNGPAGVTSVIDVNTFTINIATDPTIATVLGKLGGYVCTMLTINNLDVGRSYTINLDRPVLSTNAGLLRIGNGNSTNSNSEYYDSGALATNINFTFTASSTTLTIFSFITINSLALSSCSLANVTVSPADCSMVQGDTSTFSGTIGSWVNDPTSNGRVSAANSMLTLTDDAAPINITGITVVDTTITVTTDVAHGYTVGQFVFLREVIPTTLNTNWRVISSVPSATTFVFTAPISGVYASGGNVSRIAVATLNIPSIIGKTYRLSWNNGAIAPPVTVTTAGVYHRSRIVGGANSSDGVTVIASSATINVTVYSNAGVASCTLGNFKCKLVELDRSVKLSAMTPIGTIDKVQPTVTNGRVLYTGFATDSYLREASHTDFNNIGTGDFLFVANGVKSTSIAYQRTIFSIGDGVSAGSVLCSFLSNGAIQFAIHNGTTFVGACITTTEHADNIEHVVAIYRTAGKIYIVVDNRVVGTGVTANAALSISNTTGYLMIGERQDFTQPWIGGSIANFRMGNTAPSLDQLSDIYNDERAFTTAINTLVLSSANDLYGISYSKEMDVYWLATNSGYIIMRNLIVQKFDDITDLGGGSVTSIDTDDNLFTLSANNKVELYMPKRLPREDRRYIGIDVERTRKFSFSGDGTAVYSLPIGWKPLDVRRGGIDMREGPTYDFTYGFDGYRWWITFVGANALVPTTVNISVVAERKR